MAERLYALFERPRGERQWKRISRYSFSKPSAVKLFQTALLTPVLNGLSVERCLRPVTVSVDESIPS